MLPVCGNDSLREMSSAWKILKKSEVKVRVFIFFYGRLLTFFVKDFSSSILSFIETKFGTSLGSSLAFLIGQFSMSCPYVSHLKHKKKLLRSTHHKVQLGVLAGEPRQQSGYFFRLGIEHSRPCSNGEVVIKNYPWAPLTLLDYKSDDDYVIPTNKEFILAFQALIDEAKALNQHGLDDKKEMTEIEEHKEVPKEATIKEISNHVSAKGKEIAIIAGEESDDSDDSL
ncbi:uncharacterized protein G2W53_005164 [Senna tora]|uniref:Uncharacterized protein n=1 Tax=Senna tora TaxID=362788 RepID=A0A835CIV2_9FABA|nr:uncharacterized protein G2W53_005164 [Senna tora]